MKNIPKFIYLQIGDDCECDDWNKVYPSHDVTWQDERIHDTDIKFELVEEDK